MKHIGYSFRFDEPFMSNLYIVVLRDLVKGQGYSLRGAKGLGGICRPKNKISCQQFMDILSATLAPKSLRGVGLQYGQLMNLAAAGIPGQLFMSAPTLEKAFRYFLDFYPLLSLNMEFTSLFEGDRCRLEVNQLYHDYAPDYVQWFQTEALLNSILTSARLLAGENLTFSNIELCYPKPPHGDVYRKQFDCPVRFSADTIVVEANFMQKKVITANDPVMKLKEFECQQALQRLRKRLTINELVVEILRKSQPEIPGQDQIAEQLNISQSALYRKLKRANTSYQMIVANFRCSQAIDYLQKGEFPMSKIAESLGFSDASNFRRAFKKWTGYTPSEFRATRLMFPDGDSFALRPCN